MSTSHIIRVSERYVDIYCSLRCDAKLTSVWGGTGVGVADGGR